MGKGKERPFKMQHPGESASRPIASLPREDVKRVVAKAAEGLPETEVGNLARAELAAMVETAEYITWGTWWAQNKERGIECGCPLASICDVLPKELYDTHPGTGVPNGNFVGTYDGLMTNLAHERGIGTGKIVELVD